MDQIEQHPRVVNLQKVIREEQFRISAAFVSGGDAAALQAVACASIRLGGWIVAGSLKPEAIERLAETATNLGLPDRLGEDVIEVALATGPELYAEIDYVLGCRSAIQVAA
jgi:hypothetical protein